MKDLLEKNAKMMYVLTVIRVYLGIIWFWRGQDKMWGQNEDFDAAPLLKSAVEKAAAGDLAVSNTGFTIMGLIERITGSGAMGDGPLVQDWWAFIVQNVLLPYVEIFNHLVPLGELLVGLGLLAGLFTRQALYFALIMNFAYLLCGSVDINPQMIILSLLLLQAKVNASRVGLDRFLFGSAKKASVSA